MDYLPEKKRTQQIQIQKKEDKIKNFREYLADKDVILAMVKCILVICNIVDLLAIRSSPTQPEDPLQHMRDYFGNYRDPMWDVMDSMNTENEQIQTDLPNMQNQIIELEKSIKEAKRRN